MKNNQESKSFWKGKGFYLALTLVIAGAATASFLAINSMMDKLGADPAPQIQGEEDIPWQEEQHTPVEEKQEDVPVAPTSPSSSSKPQSTVSSAPSSSPASSAPAAPASSGTSSARRPSATACPSVLLVAAVVIPFQAAVAPVTVCSTVLQQQHGVHARLQRIALHLAPSSEELLFLNVFDFFF